MNRRAFVGALALGILSAPLAADAQQRGGTCPELDTLTESGGAERL